MADDSNSRADLFRELIELGPQPVWTTMPCGERSHVNRGEMSSLNSAPEKVRRAYDASQSLATERALHQTLVNGKARLRMALEAGPIGIWETDFITHEIHWDQRPKAIYGYPANFAPRERIALKDARISFDKLPPVLMSEDHARVFKVFKQPPGRQFSGAGVRRTLCKRIVEHYRENIWIESRSGQGATVFFTPPVAADLSQHAVEKTQ